MINDYPNIVEDILDYQAQLMKAFWVYDYASIEKYSRKIQVLINKVLKDNLLLVKRH